MDIICPRCAEPIEADAIHDEVAARKSGGDKKATWAEVRKEFYAKGCGLALRESYSLGLECEDRRTSQAAQASAALHEVLGYDIDGIAAELADLGFTR